MRHEKKADPNYYNPVPDLEKIYGRKETSTNSPAATPSIEKAVHQERKSLTPADFRKLREETMATMDWEALAERDEPVKHKPKTFIHNPIPPADLLD